MLVDIARHERTEKYADTAPRIQNRKGARKLLSWKKIRKHRVRRRNSACLARANSEPRECELPRATSQSAATRHHTPDKQAGSDNHPSIETIRPSRDRQSEQSIEQHESETSN